MKPDPTVDRIREARHRISEKFGHDPKRLVEHYMKLQEQYKERLVDSTEVKPKSEDDKSEGTPSD